MIKFLDKIQSFLEKIDSYRDKVLFVFIKPCWPKKIIPNHITYIRLIIGTLLFILLFFFGIENKILIFSLFCIGVLTDFIDGPVARGTNKVTEFGAMLDSTSDRVLILPIAIYSLYEMHKWLLLILILAEIINAIFSIYYKSKDIYLESNIFGKIKMALFSVPFIAILFFWPFAPSKFFIYMLWITLPFSFLSIFVKVLELKNKNKINVPQLKNF